MGGKELSVRTVWTAYRRTVELEDFDARDLDTNSDGEALELAARQLKRELWPATARGDLIIDSQEVAPKQTISLRLNLSSDADDLDVEEVAE